MFAQPVAERDAVVKHKTFATPAALGFRHAFQVLQDSALEVVDLRKTARQQIGAGLFAADAAGAEHRNFAMLRRMEMARGKSPEWPKALDARVDRASECAHRDLERIAGVDQERIRRRDQIVPVGGLDIDADLPCRIGAAISERDDFLLQPDFQPSKRHCRGMREFQLEVIEPAAEQGAVAQFMNQCVDRLRAARKRAVDAFMGQQHAALQPEIGADRAQRLAQLPEIRQRGELIEGGDLMGHRRWFIRRDGMGKAAKIYRRPLRTQGPIRGALTIDRCSQCLCDNKHRWLWVPACAGTTLMLSYAPPAIAPRYMNVPCRPAPGVGPEKC